MKTWAFRISIALILAVLFYWLYPTTEANPRPTWWGIEHSATEQPTNQVSILDFQLGKTNLQDIINQLKIPPSTALFTKRQRPGEAEPAIHLEAYFEDVFDEGDRIIIGLDADDSLLKHIKKIAFQPELFPNDVIRVGIPPSFTETVINLPIKNITLIAGWQVKFEEFKERYGEPDQIIDDGRGNAHFLYPNMGLDFIQPADGLQILQFVAVEKFQETLLSPLLQSLPTRALKSD